MDFQFEDTLKKKTKFATTEAFVFFPTVKPIRKTEESAMIRDALVFKDIGNEYFQEKNFYDAIANYNKAISKMEKMGIQSNFLELALCYQNRAAAYEQMKQIESSIMAATKAIEIDETYAKAYYRRAKCFIEQKKMYCALQDMVQACILEKFKNKMYNNIAAELNTKFSKYLEGEIEKFSEI